jgi:hypothetical protein
MTVYILTYDKLVIETLKITESLYKQFWHEANIIVLGYETPNWKSDTIKFMSLGKDLGTDVVCSQLHDFFNSIEDDYFILEVDDKPIVNSVDNTVIEYLEELIKINNNIGRIGLTNDNWTRTIETSSIVKINKKDYTLFENSPSAEYRLSSTMSMWNKEFFLKYLKSYDNLWQWECSNTNDSYRIMGLFPAPVDFTHIYKKGRLRSDWYKSPHTGMNHTEDNKQLIRDIYGF